MRGYFLCFLLPVITSPFLSWIPMLFILYDFGLTLESLFLLVAREWVSSVRVYY
jgi:hypothetical protein